ncbi:hypothetical protein F5Y18DRAFT_188331 [Xylariaceae sp. FL1019]|nr:hypothetical protein F5Y18DRAFT_188331 [Xylariaceae sp. FL1019]
MFPERAAYVVAVGVTVFFKLFDCGRCSTTRSIVIMNYIHHQLRTSKVVYPYAQIHFLVIRPHQVPTRTVTTDSTLHPQITSGVTIW